MQLLFHSICLLSGSAGVIGTSDLIPCELLKISVKLCVLTQRQIRKATFIQAQI